MGRNATASAGAGERNLIKTVVTPDGNQILRRWLKEWEGQPSFRICYQ